MNQTEYNLFLFYYIIATIAITLNFTVIGYMIYHRYLRIQEDKKSNNNPNNPLEEPIMRSEESITQKSTKSLISRMTNYIEKTRKKEIFKKNFLHNPFYFAILMLHISNAGEEITLIPWIYKGNYGLCLFMESIKYYFSLLNCFSWFFLIQSYRLFLFADAEPDNKGMKTQAGKDRLESRIISQGDLPHPTKSSGKFEYFGRSFTYHPDFRYFIYFIFFIFPMVCFIPFITGTYRSSSSPWCTVDFNSDFYVGLFLEYLWIWLALIACLLTNLYIFLKIILIHQDYDLLNRYVHHAGLYSFVACIGWIPRSIVYLLVPNSNQQSFIQYIPTYISGILYCCLFYLNRKSIFYYDEADFHESEMELNISDLFQIVDDLEPFNTLMRNTLSFIGGGPGSIIRDSSVSKRPTSIGNENSMEFINRPSQQLRASLLIKESKVQQKGDHNDLIVSRESQSNPIHDDSAL